MTENLQDPLDILYSELPELEKSKKLSEMKGKAKKYVHSDSFFLEVCRKNDPLVMTFSRIPSRKTIVEIIDEDYEWGIAWLLKRIGISQLQDLARKDYQRLRLNFYLGLLPLYQMKSG